MNEIACTLCDVPLRNATDTFGEWNYPMCWDCYAGLVGENEETWYGLAPHHHDLTITGSVIGSTVFDPLPERGVNGEYDLGDRTFMPDPEAPGCGVWTRKIMAGWR